MSSTNRTRWRTQRNFSKLSLSNGSVLLGCKMPDWVLGLFCFWHHPDLWSTVIPDSSVLCLFMKATVYLWYYPRSIHPFFFIACPIQGQSPAYCRDSAQRQRTIYAPIRSYNLFRIISYTNKNVLGLWRKPCMHRQTAHTKMPQRAGRFESRPFLLWGNDAVQIFSRKKDAVAEINVWVSWVVQ